MNNDDDEHLLARVDTRLMHVEAMMDEFLRKAEFHAQFKPVALIAYGLAGIALAAVMGAVVAQVVK